MESVRYSILTRIIVELFSLFHARNRNLHIAGLVPVDTRQCVDGIQQKQVVLSLILHSDLGRSGEAVTVRISLGSAVCRPSFGDGWRTPTSSYRRNWNLSSTLLSSPWYLYSRSIGIRSSNSLLGFVRRVWSAGIPWTRLGGLQQKKKERTHSTGQPEPHRFTEGFRIRREWIRADIGSHYWMNQLGHESLYNDSWPIQMSGDMML